MKIPKIAVLSFPGNNCEVESIRAVRRAGMVPVFFRWNDDTEKLKNVDGYFIPGGFSYEDRGRAGMVAARDPLMDFIRSEAKEGKPVIGNCNGAQILVESGLIPLGDQLQMCLARNVVDGEAVGFLNEGIFIIPTCARNRCATSDWEGVMTLHYKGSRPHRRTSEERPNRFLVLRCEGQCLRGSGYHSQRIRFCHCRYLQSSGERGCAHAASRAHRGGKPVLCISEALGAEQDAADIP